MKLSFSLFVSLLGCSFSVMAQSNFNEDEVVKIERCNEHDFREGELIVKFKPESKVRMTSNKTGNFSSSNVSAVDVVMKKLGVQKVEPLMPLTGAVNAGRRMKSYSGQIVESQDLSKLYCIQFDQKTISSVYEAVEMVEGIEGVEFAEPNYLVYSLLDSAPKTIGLPGWLSWNDPLFSQLWGISAIHADKLWLKPTITDKKPVIAIIDTGVEIDHPDLAKNIWTNTKESNGEEGYDDDGNGFIDDIHGWDFVNQTGRMRDNNGHGTHCAGIAAAVGGNGIGIIGANPDAIIMPVAVMQSDGTGDVATIIKGIDYAAANGADIISMSIGGYGYSMAEEQALGKAYAKAVLVAAAGNDSHDLTGCYCMCLTNKPMFPAAFTFVLGVEASTLSGELADFSNRDLDGPIFSEFGEEKLYNYELRAPGTNVLSTFPGGKYKELSGTSMACPLVAGALSRLLSIKEYNNKEIMYADLIHSSKNKIIDVLAAYNIKDEERKPDIYFITYELKDLLDGDGRPDAGETLEIFPIIRNSWGLAKNIKASIELSENEDSNIITILDNNVDFGWNLDAYGKNKSLNPIRIKINENCADRRHICLVLKCICDDMSESINQNVVLEVENGVEIGGMITKDLTLYPNVHYIVTNKLAVPPGVTLTIQPGTTLEFRDNTGLSMESGSHLVAHGMPNKMIYFKPSELGYSLKDFVINTEDTISYAVISGFRTDYSKVWTVNKLNNCVISYLSGYGHFFSYNFSLDRCNIVYNDMKAVSRPATSYHHSNIVANNGVCPWWRGDSHYVSMDSSNTYGQNVANNCESTTVEVIKTQSPSYFGSTKESIVRQNVVDIMSGSGYSSFDFSNMLTRPVAEAQGIVWKVVVNGYDAQDEFDQLTPLGVGKHKFEVYFNRPMDKSIAPKISMGVRPPYTQVAIGEDGAWNEAGDIYTAYLNITGKTSTDGLNRIYVYGAQDDEFFEIPEEKYRFNVNVQAAGSMSSGFMGLAGLGKVTLSWADAKNSFDDFLGYNLYRYTTTPEDYVKINEQLLDNETLEYIDYDVIPGTTYHYFYKVLTTDLIETDKSNVIAITPQTSTKGDANGSGDVDVADVITTVNYAAGQQPKPFIYEAADMNVDNNIDILDVIGIIKAILNPQEATNSMSKATAEYSIENGVIYVDCTAPLAGVQIHLLTDGRKDISICKDMEIFEGTSAWLSDNDYIYLGYNMNGKTLSPGKHAILNIGDATIGDVRLSDASGKNIIATSQGVTSINQLLTNSKMFNGIYSICGTRVNGYSDNLHMLPKGVYIINGEKVIK